MNLKQIKDAARQAFRDQQSQDTEGGVPDAVSYCAGMLPPPTKTDTVTSYLVYCYYPEVIGNATDQLDIANSQLWEPEDEEK